MNYGSPAIRIVIVSLLAGWGIFFSVGLICYFAHFTPDSGYYRIVAGDGVTIDLVEPHLSATTGVVPGDKLDESDTPFDQRRAASYVGGQLPAIGAHETLRIVHHGRARTITLTAVPGAGYWDLQFRIATISQGVVGVLFVLVGALLVLLRPSKMSWAFFVYCVGVNPSTAQPIGWLYWSPHWLWSALVFGTDILRAAGYAAIPFFAARFPLDRPMGKIQKLVETGALVFFPVFLAGLMYKDVAALILQPVPPLFYDAANIGVNVVYVAALVAFLATYRAADATTRQRTRWVMGGLAVGVGVRTLLNLSDVLGLDFPAWVLWFQPFLSLAVPVSVVYAVLKYRVFDITFIISRALAITLISSFFLAAFAVADSLFHLRLASSNLGLGVEAAVAISLSLTLHGLQHRIIHYSDKFLFRARHRSAKHLMTIRDRMPLADSTSDIERLLLEEPCEALSLRSGGIYVRNADGSYRRTSVCGDGADLPDSLDAHSSITARIGDGTHIDPVWLRGASPKRMHAKLSGHSGPALAMPVVVHRVCQMLVLYGHHQNGADFDPDEIRHVAALGVAASAAYAGLEAEAMRQRSTDVDILRQQNESLRLEIEALKAAGAAPNANNPGGIKTVEVPE